MPISLIFLITASVAPAFHTMQWHGRGIAPQVTTLATGEVAANIPRWVSWTKTVPVDFDIYRLNDVRTNQELLGIYVGNNPQFDPARVSQTWINGLRVHDRRVCTTKCNRDILFELPKTASDTYVEMWYNDLSPRQAALSDAIIESLHYRKLSRHIFERQM